MKNKYITILIITFIILISLGLIGFTYSWFTINILGNDKAKNVIVDASGMILLYTDDTPINLNSILPGDSVSKTFSIKNQSSNNMEYQIAWKDLINEFKAGELRLTLNCISKDSNGNVSGTCESTEDKMIPYTETQNDYKIKDNITIGPNIIHEYTMIIEFEEKNIKQSYNKNKSFNGKINILNATQKPVNNCTFDGNLTQGAEYTNGQYTYRYMQEYYFDDYEEEFYWSDIDADGWGVTLTDKDSTDAVTTPLCTSINGKPIVSMSSMFADSQATSLDLSSFDTSNVTIMYDMFYSSKATTLDLSSFDTSNVTDMYGMFRVSQATTLDLSSFDTSNVTDMCRMFMQSQATAIDLSGFDTSNVTDMEDMFSSSQATTLDLSSFDTSNVTDMVSMFSSSQATTIDLSNFDTSNVTDMVSMFSSSQATTIDLSSFDTSNVISMWNMFYASKATQIIGLDKFNTSKVTEIQSMFAHSQATTIDLSSFDTSNVTDMYGMFYESKATTIDLSSFDTSKVTDMQKMFQSSKATTIYVSDKWNTSLVTNSNNMFYGVTNLVGGEGTTYSSSNPTDKTYAHVDGGVSNPGYFTDKNQIEEGPSAPTRPVNNCTFDGELVQGAEYTNGQYIYRYKQEGVDSSHWQNITGDGWGVMQDNKGGISEPRSITTTICTSINGKPIVSMSYMFEDSRATSIDLSSFDTSNVTNMSYMFHGSRVTELDLSSFDTSNVTDMKNMFWRSEATTLDLSSFDTSNVTDMSDMFNNSKSTSLDLSSFDTSNVTDMNNMFYASQATTLDLSSFDTRSVTNMRQMFRSINATTIYVSDKWNTSSVTDSYYMFLYAENIIGGQGTTYKSSSLSTDVYGTMYAHVDGGTSNPGYFTYKAN